MNRIVLLFPASSCLFVRISLLFYFVGFSNAVFAQRQEMQITLVPSIEGIMTDLIQNAIDTCALAGGGTVHLSEGVFLSGSLQLKSNVTLHLKKGALLQGSNNVKDNTNDASSLAKIFRMLILRAKG